MLEGSDNLMIPKIIKIDMLRVPIPLCLIHSQLQLPNMPS